MVPASINKSCYIPTISSTGLDLDGLDLTRVFCSFNHILVHTTSKFLVGCPSHAVIVDDMGELNASDL